MLAAIVAVVVLHGGQCDPPALESTARRTSVVRSGERWVSSLIDDGLRRSPTFARLARTIEEHRAIVYVEPRSVLTAGLVGAVPSVVSRTPDGTRYMRVWVRQDKPRDQIIETIGHELQHVVELLEKELGHGSSDLAAGTTRSRHWVTGFWITETAAARHAGQAVHLELLERHGTRRRIADPGGATSNAAKGTR